MRKSHRGILRINITALVVIEHLPWNRHDGMITREASRWTTLNGCAQYSIHSSILRTSIQLRVPLQTRNTSAEKYARIKVEIGKGGISAKRAI